MVVRKKVIEAVSGKYHEGIKNSSSTEDDESQSKSKTYKAGVIEKKTVILKSEKDDFIYKYNLRLHGGRGDKSTNATLSDDIKWVEKLQE